MYKMSASQRVRKSSPVKQGPMRATIPMASLLRHSNNLRKSPTLSPTAGWRSRISPDSSSSGQRSPGSITYKAKSKTLSATGDVGSGNIIRRTASLDAIYLKGQWPRESFYIHSGLLQVDKATQTEDVSIDSRKSLRLNEPCSSDDKLDKLLRQRLQRSKDGGNGRISSGPYSVVGLPSSSSQTGVISCMLPSPTTKASPMNIPVKQLPKPPMRNSIEGLNQEIERLVLKATGYHGVISSDRYEEEKYQQQVTPEGHRAPLADLLRSTRSVNTQTPAASDLTGSCQSSGPPSRDSGSPLIPGLLDVSKILDECISVSSSEHGGSQGSSPDQDPHKLGTSPHINRFLAREPPDGCEKVNLKFSEHPSRQPVIDSFDYCPLKPCVTFQLKPSLGSAFYPLHPVDRENEEMKSGLGSGLYPVVDRDNEDVMENSPFVPPGNTAEQDIV